MSIKRFDEWTDTRSIDFSDKRNKEKPRKLKYKEHNERRRDKTKAGKDKGRL